MDCTLTLAAAITKPLTTGHAPIGDVCGYAGGSPSGQDGPEAGDYVNTTYAHHGMKGSDLPKMPTGTVWEIGGEATVSWNVR